MRDKVWTKFYNTGHRVSLGVGNKHNLSCGLAANYLVIYLQVLPRDEKPYLGKAAEENNKCLCTYING
jgi:hypothetical protein